jgi:anti-anti-sigma factor
MGEASLLDHLGPGDHACLVFDDELLRVGSVAACIRAGLRQHHRILYCGPGVDRLPAMLTGHGVDITTALSSGQLSLAAPDRAYLSDGIFDPEVSLAAWMKEVAAARAAGYRGMRGIGDMSWAHRCTGIEQLARYEAEVNRICVDGYTMGVCLYDRRLFSELELRRVTRSHPATISRYTDPSRFPLLRVVRTGKLGLRLEGEVDLSNRQALRAMVRHLAEDGGTVRTQLTLDVSELRFADSAAARILLSSASGGRHRLRVVGASETLRRLLLFHRAGKGGDLRFE